MTDQAEAAAREIAIERARDALRKHGIDINLPHEGDLDDLERDHYDGLVDAYYAIAAAIRSAGPQWQPIESAPKDGTVIDLWCRAPGLSAGPARVPDCWYSDGRWWRYDNEHGDDQCRSRVHNATHWMPLPAPPAPPEAPGDF